MCLVKTQIILCICAFRSVCICHSVDSQCYKYSSCAQGNFWSNCWAEQANQCLHWVHMSFCRFHCAPDKNIWIKIEPWHDKTNKMSVCTAKTQISPGICPVWSESLLCAQWVAKDPRLFMWTVKTTHWAHSKDSEQTGRMPRLIWVFAGCALILLVLSCCSSNLNNNTTCWN